MKKPQKPSAKKGQPSPALRHQSKGETKVESGLIPKGVKSEITSFPHPHSAPALWAYLETTMLTLVELVKATPETLEFDSLSSTLNAALDILESVARRGGVGAKAAIQTIYRISNFGCKRLEKLACDDDAREVLKDVASERSEWPVRLSPKISSYRAARKYLVEIGVGTKSIPPTANTKISAEVRWTELADMVIKKILVYQPLLNAQWEGNSPVVKRAYASLLEEARKYPEIANLPNKLNTKTRAAYWKVGKKILKDYWENNPDDANADFKKFAVTVKKSLEKSGETTGKSSDEKDRAKSRIVAIHSVREAFYMLART